MIPTIPCLQAFIEPVAVCLPTVRVTTALASLEQSTNALPTLIFQDRLVLVDEQQHAIGWVSSQHLLKHLMKVGRFDQASKRDQLSRDQPFEELPLAGQADVKEPGESELTENDPPLIEITPSLVAPLVLLSDTLSIDQCLPYLQAQPHACYGVETIEGAFLGLLDTVRLLEFLTRPVLELSANQPKTPLVASLANGVNQGAAPSPLSVLLRELLEHLPLPVMLQTQDGRVLAQNSHWRNQVSELLDPGWLRQEVAALLETTPVEAPPPSDRAVKAAWEHSIAALGQPHLQLSEVLRPFIPSKPRSENTLSEKAFSEKAFSEVFYLDEVSEAVKANDPAGSACHIGTKPGTCICVCPLKDGQEQVLQFVRIPIGTLASHVDLAGLDRASIVTTAMEAAVFDAETAAALPFFRLATLLSNLQDTQSSDQGRSHAEQSENYTLNAPEVALNPPIPDTEELWLVLAQDITEQQELARELTAKNADLIQLNRLKDEFLACISHELRTPLTAVLGLSSLLKDQTLGDLNPRQVHYAQLIHQSGRHLMAVVNNILDLTRIETGQLELVVEPVNIKTVCQRAFEQAQQLRQQEKNQNAADSDGGEPTFSLQLEPGLELLVADEQRLRQMLVHLLSNALKFTESNDPVGLKVGHWGGWIAFTVWDTGIGIPPEKQHLIFQKFQQLENPLTRRFEGTGLGLVLTQRLARLHGGDVTFVSKENQGSQFTILLPPKPPGTHPADDAFSTQSVLATSDRTAQPDPSDSLAHPLELPLTSPASIDAYALDVSAFQRNQLVLIVEAVPQCIEALSDQLTGLGYRVVIARSGTEALEKARRLQPCIIFLNPVLPLLSGWDVLTLLKSNLETRRLPVVITATKVDEEQSHQRHADHLLSLPIQPKALQRCIQHLVVDLQETQPAQRAAKVLTVLRLSPGVWSNHHQPLPTADLNLLLHSRQHRMLEADDLEQAELLARVWKPDVVLLDGILSDRAAYFQQYSQHIFLASLPLVTIDPETTQVANQVPGLLVFPCLSTIGAQGKLDASTESSALLQVVQVAAGYALRPSILALDAAKLPASLDVAVTPGALDLTLGCSFTFKETEWLQALTQYLNTAGMRGLVGRCWQEVLQQAESYSVDVLLLCWTDDSSNSQISSMLTALHKLPNRPPILVLDHRQHHQPFAAQQPGTIAALPSVLEQLATQVLPASLPMSELLKHIHQAIRASKR